MSERSQRRPLAAMTARQGQAFDGQRPAIFSLRGTRLDAVRRLSARPPELAASGALLSVGLDMVFGTLAAVMFFGFTALLFCLGPVRNVRQVLAFSPLLVIPVLAIISTLWSDAPQASMRAGIELLATVLATIVICRNLRPERMILVLFIGFLINALLIVPYIPPALAADAPLIAFMGSKNQVGFVGYMIFILAIAIVADRQQFWASRVIALLSIPLALLLGYLAKSGGTTSSLILGVVIFPPLAMLGAVKPPVRTVLIALALLLFVFTAIFRDDLVAAIDAFRTNVLQKDATFTGRTYLWDFADRLAQARPLLGYGYGSFWRQGNLDAEGLWRWAGIPNRGGFNFHNEFMEMKVNLGLVGQGLLIATCAAVALIALVRQMIRPSVPLACLIAIMAVSYVRSLVENGLLAPFSEVTMMWFATLLYAFPSSFGRSAAAQRDPANQVGTDDVEADQDTPFGWQRHRGRMEVRPRRKPAALRLS